MRSARWADLTNERLRTDGHRARVDHRSLEAQGVDRTPTTHVGPAVTALDRRGTDTAVGYRLQAEATERLQRAAELGRLEREGREVARQIIDVSTELAVALLQRAAEAGRTAVHSAPSPSYPGVTKPPAATPERDVERLRAAAVDDWLRLRETRQSGRDADEPVRGADRQRASVAEGQRGRPSDRERGL